MKPRNLLKNNSLLFQLNYRLSNLRNYMVVNSLKLKGDQPKLIKLDKFKITLNQSNPFSTLIHNLNSISINDRLSENEKQNENFVLFGNEEDKGDKIDDKCLIGIYGIDRIKFLNGLTTNLIEDNMDITKAQYNAFLNPQGRVLADTILFPSPKLEEPILLLINEKMKSILLKHLLLYKLISKVRIEDLTEHYHILWSNKIINQFNESKLNNIKIFKDPRINNFGSWILINKDKDTSLSKIFPNQQFNNPNYYYKQLLLNGLGETPFSIKPNHALPMESNLEKLNGMHFRKGCYIGQELTIRTHHKGVIRKRLFYAKCLEGRCPPEGTEIFLKIDNELNPVKSKPKSIAKVMLNSEPHLMLLVRFQSIKMDTSFIELYWKDDSNIIPLKLEFIIPSFLKEIF